MYSSLNTQLEAERVILTLKVSARFQSQRIALMRSPFTQRQVERLLFPRGTHEIPNFLEYVKDVFSVRI